MVELEVKVTTVVNLRSLHGRGGCESSQIPLSIGGDSGGPQIEGREGEMLVSVRAGIGRGCLRRVQAFMEVSVRLDRWMGCDPVLPWWDPQFVLPRPSGGAVLAKGEAQGSEGARSQGSGHRGLCLNCWREKACSSLSLFPQGWAFRKHSHLLPLCLTRSSGRPRDFLLGFAMKNWTCGSAPSSWGPAATAGTDSGLLVCQFYRAALT